jgi:hypothetical protein
LVLSHVDARGAKQLFTKSDLQLGQLFGLKWPQFSRHPLTMTLRRLPQRRKMFP